MKFAEKVREQRERRGFQQGELANMLGVSRWTISNYEKGVSHPQDRNIYFKLAEIFDMDVNYFLTENEEFLSTVSEKYGKRGVDQANALLQGAAALYAGGELSDSDKEAFENLMQEIFFKSKEIAKGKYTPKKYRLDNAELGGVDNDDTSDTI